MMDRGFGWSSAATDYSDTTVSALTDNNIVAPRTDAAASFDMSDL
jgi:hypothetical protein